MGQRSIQILLADDHEMVRKGIRTLLETQAGWEVCGEASNGREAVRLAAQLNPHIAVLDLEMPELNGLEATRQIKKGSLDAEVLIYSMHVPVVAQPQFQHQIRPQLVCVLCKQAQRALRDTARTLAECYAERVRFTCEE